MPESPFRPSALREGVPERMTLISTSLNKEGAPSLLCRVGYVIIIACRVFLHSQQRHDPSSSDPHRVARSAVIAATASEPAFILA